VTIPDAISAAFVKSGLWAGLALLTEDRIKKAQNDLLNANPQDIVRVSKLQQEVKTWQDVGGIQNQISKYTESFGQAKS